MKSHINSLQQNVQLNEPTIDRTKETADEISKEIVLHHLNSFVENNIEGVLSDYTNESVLITQAATYSSLEEISAFFIDLNIHFPQQGSNFVLDKIVAKDDLVYIVWHATTPSLQVPIGSDTFIIKDGKIYQQTFVGQLNFINQQP
jgi:predicted SnoaL-like aldol condensation-catalyzing enzyme